MRPGARCAKYGPWAVVTGASDGIGREIAIEIARSGLNIVIVARREAQLAETAERLRALGCEVRTIVTDLSTTEGRARVVNETAHIDVGMLVNSAGYGAAGSFLAADPLSAADMIEVNCTAVVALAHAFSERFARRGGGALVFLSSIVAFQGVAQQAVYSATKGFIQTFAEALRLELAPVGIDVLAVAPGPVNTGFARRAGMRAGGASAQTVARATVRAIGRRGTVRPGLVAAALELGLKLPRWARSRILSMVIASMVEHTPSSR